MSKRRQPAGGRLTQRMCVCVWKKNVPSEVEVPLESGTNGQAENPAWEGTRGSPGTSVGKVVGREWHDRRAGSPPVRVRFEMAKQHEKGLGKGSGRNYSSIVATKKTAELIRMRKARKARAWRLRHRVGAVGEATARHCPRNINRHSRFQRNHHRSLNTASPRPGVQGLLPGAPSSPCVQFVNLTLQALQRSRLLARFLESPGCCFLRPPMIGSAELKRATWIMTKTDGRISKLKNSVPLGKGKRYFVSGNMVGTPFPGSKIQSPSPTVLIV